jgi:hypothetical protein
MAYDSINFGGDARRAHLALVEGGASISTNSTSAATRAIGTDPVLRASAPAPAFGAPTAYATNSVEGPRSRHEAGVRAVAANYENFEDALLPMVLASGVSGEAASSVAEAIMGNPALRAQAERAFQRARLHSA